MIKKTLLLTGLLFAAYSIFVTWLAPKWWHASQHQWQDNIIKAQQYLYRTGNTFNNVIVGSSLSCRLIVDSLPQTYNLSFSGHSIFDGLHILTQDNNLPKHVFIEMNVVLRPESKDFTSSVNSLLFYPKKVVPSLRDDKQPIAIIGNKITYSITDKIINRDKSAVNPYEDHSGHSDLFSKMLQLQIEEYSKVPGDSLLNEVFGNLKKYIAELEKRNVTVIFFEMPVYSQLLDLPQATIIREVFNKNFPPSKYQYIPLPDLKFTTTDGVHLSGDEALKYTLYLKTYMEP